MSWDRWLAPEALMKIVLQLMLLVIFSQTTACTTTRTASGDMASESLKLELKAGDEIRIITSRRERLKMIITEVKVEGLDGKTVKWDASQVAANQEISVLYSDLAFIQLDKPSPAKTVGLVASVTFIGALIGAVTVAPSLLLVP
jgi:hypothetical protein